MYAVVVMGSRMRKSACGMTFRSFSCANAEVTANARASVRPRSKAQSTFMTFSCARIVCNLCQCTSLHCIVAITRSIGRGHAAAAGQSQTHANEHNANSTSIQHNYLHRPHGVRVGAGCMDIPGRLRTA